MLRKGFLKGHSNALNFVLRLVDVSIVLSIGVLSYYLSNAYETYTALNVQGLPQHYIKVILLAAVLIFHTSKVQIIEANSSISGPLVIH